MRKTLTFAMTHAVQTAPCSRVCPQCSPSGGGETGGMGSETHAPSGIVIGPRGADMWPTESPSRDCTLVEAVFRTRPAGNQKSINLNADVLTARPSASLIINTITEFLGVRRRFGSGGFQNGRAWGGE